MLNTLSTLINKLNETVGKTTGLLVLPLVAVVFYEVILRYVFNAPTVWGFEMTVFLYGVHFMLGLGFTEGRDGHVKVDVLVARLSKRGQALVGIITSCLFFLPIWGIMSYAGLKYAYTSTMNGELNSTSWAPPIWPLKILLAVGFILLFLQGVSTLVRHIQVYRGLGE